MGHNEMLIGEALKGVPREQYLVSVKFGALRDPASGWMGFDARPAAVKNFLAYSLQRLGLDHIDIYRPARLDPTGADRGDGGRDRRHGEGRLCPPHRPLRGRRRDAAPRRGGPSDLRSADRIFADLARHRGRDPADGPRARHRHHRLWRAVARPHQRSLAQGGRRARRFPRPQPALPGRAMSMRISRWSRACAASPRRWASASRKSPSPGWRSRARTSCRSIGARRRDRLSEALGALGVKLSAKDLAAIEARCAARRGRRRALPRGGHGRVSTARDDVRPKGSGHRVEVARP